MRPGKASAEVALNPRKRLFNVMSLSEERRENPHVYT
jgi:hypothetical protein